MGKDAFIEYLRIPVFYYSIIIHQLKAILSCFSQSFLKHNSILIFFGNLLNRLTFTPKINKNGRFLDGLPLAIIKNKI
jgi:hypothetical protein